MKQIILSGTKPVDIVAPLSLPLVILSADIATMRHRPKIPAIVSNTSIAYALDEKRMGFSTKVYNGGATIMAFRGGHSDIGGGYPLPERGLAEIYLVCLLCME